ncbi:MAG: type IV toxin-antitoxin system AbiEi family antitoxin domain-containing protein [Thiobacillaceae bacterium]
MLDSKDALRPRRARLAAVIKAAGDVVRIGDAVRALGISRKQAAKLLSRWAAQGWLRRVGTGTYVAVQLEFLDAETVVQDPWILVPSLFAPAYIGGRTAAEHWDLTEQIFRDVVVFTARPVRVKTVERQTAVFTLKHIRQDQIFGTKPVWRGQTRVDVSDIHRTMVDMLDDPAAGGGIQHVADCFMQYMQRPDRDTAKLVEYADRLGNGAIFKRMGFLAERQPEGKSLRDACKERLTKGYASLDPALDCRRLITRWRLRVPQHWISEPGT